MTLSEAREMFTLTRTRFDRAYVGKFDRGMWCHVFGDDTGDYARTGPWFASKAEALAALPAAVAGYYGEDDQR